MENRQHVVTHESDENADTVPIIIASNSKQECQSTNDSLTSKDNRRKRFMALFAFSLLTGSNGMQWITFAPIAVQLEGYYNVTSTAINWLSQIYMATYILFILPSTWLLETDGLKAAVTYGGLLNAIGAWLRYSGSHPDTFWLLMVGQIVSSLAQSFTLGIPAKLAAIWFPMNQRSAATAIAVFANQVGSAIGFILSPISVPVVINQAVFSHNLSNLLLAQACSCMIIIILIFIGTAQYNDNENIPSVLDLQLARDDDQESISGNQNHIIVTPRHPFTRDIKMLIMNRNFMLLLISYGIITGSYYAISTLLGEIILPEIPNQEVAVGIMGFILIISGLVGAFLVGFWLDWTRRFKGTTVTFYIFSVIAAVAFTLGVYFKQLEVLYFICGAFGFFATAILPVGFEFAAEMTYPISEGLSSGLLNCSAQIFGISLISIMDRILNRPSHTLIANCVLIGLLALGMILTWIIKLERRRENMAT
ncbi:uncharacterized protein TRIADDRAFT_59549 [Trichoplax adhaerens]|uniref:Major facilitator superfamily (MFS) profile domain-containing protein n=1 Tax=Trichoplax adhaerens TaxID=10228 RepID=B3S5Y3_TRIAD|nr:hypothetical protein TRIADDRAFT_59549 [Trichoplax adhaerens]EDV21992.1 hypothetical protein TRIADDRAFT_59549 [Trichoplax adhaerens]|eukprot:XP_002115629.1 hypothetical protein TRIADDRAFT_59549 [Trichoplax adhaerens]